MSNRNEKLTLRPMTRGMQLFAMIVFFSLGVGATAFALINPLDLPFLPSGSRSAQAESAATEAHYQCPMHPEVIEDQPGECPICHMDLVLSSSATAGGGEAASDDTLYQCPMHPEVIEDHPEDCPICLMKLMPMDATNSASDSDQIYIDPAQVQNIGVLSEMSELQQVSRTARTLGILDFNADNITWVNTKYPGWIETVHVTYVGQEVEQGDPLFEIYSPELVTTQEEYLRALEYRASLQSSKRREARLQADKLLQSTRDRLLYWDISDAQIDQLAVEGRVRRTLTVSAPTSGVVTEVMDRSLEGMFVNAGMNLYKIADLSTIWVHADVFEADLPWVREKQRVDVSFAHDTSLEVTSKVLFLYPELNENTRTLKICVEIPNPDGSLRPGMFANVTVHGPTIGDAVVIPSSAVIRSGRRQMVFVDVGQGHFAPRQVTLGIDVEPAHVQIVSGLRQGELVVTQAQFMLDSESKMQEAIARFRQRGDE